MTDMMSWLLLVAASAFIFTAIIRHYAIKKKIIDMPGNRSSHTVPIPRGGGLAILLSAVGGAVGLVWQDFLPAQMLFYMGPGIALGLIGFADDHRHIAFGYRLLAQLLAVAGLFWLFGGALGLTGIFTQGYAYFPVVIILVIAFVWFINLYNFMDGINGIAALETISITVGSIVIAHALNEAYFIPLAGLFMAATCGFVLWNFPVARIFMGDSGSLFCGYTVVLLMLVAAESNVTLFWSIVVLSAVFVVDASVTLSRRLLQREKVWEAHCSHAYQRLARRWQSHTRVTFAVVAINIFWLLPIAWLLTSRYFSVAAALALAYIPLIVLAVILGAGRKEVLTTS